MNQDTVPAGARASSNRRRAWRESIAVSSAALFVVGAGILGLWVTSTRALRANYREHLIDLAQTAALLVDPVLHAELRRPGQRNGPEYTRAIEPLRRMQKTVADVHYIYTLAPDGAVMRFVLDTSDPGARTPAGAEDQAAVGELYALEDPAMRIALGDGVHPGVPAATDRPYSDRWGTFMTGWAPLRDASDRQIGILGVDVDASVYAARLSAAPAWAFAGLAPAGLLMIAMGFVFYRIRLRSLDDAEAAFANAEAAERAAASLAVQQQRLSDVIEGANVGTWEWHLTDGRLDVNDRYAKMLGLSRDEVSALNVEDWRGLVHPDDRVAMDAAVEAFLRHPHDVLPQEFRMRHADGRFIWMWAVCKVLECDPDGRPLRLGGINLDVSIEKAAELSLIASESKFRSLFELSPVGISLNDLHTGRFLQMNAALLQPTGYSAEELLQMSGYDITPARYAATDAAQFEILERTGRYGPYEKEYLRKDGSTYPVLLSGIRMLDEAGQAVVWSITQDISQRKSLERALAESALRDKLTGLPNRALFMESLQNAVTRLQSGQQACFAVLFIDFDQFKLVNDTLGHTAGDELLRQISKRLLGALRTGDAGGDSSGNVVSRFGGDEFLILINDLKKPDDACKVAERLLNVLAAAYDILGSEVQSTASIGIVTSETCSSSVEELVRNADVAMYEAKRSGRACSVIFNEAMHTRITRHVRVETALRRALGSSELYLVYQPIVELSTGRMVSVEALIRWNHPELGEISPSEFIPIAEESGLIVAVGHWVQKEACQAFLGWRAADPVRAPKTVSVNVSRAELALGSRLLERVQHTLEGIGLEPQCLQLEVTEREVMRNPEPALEVMQELRRLGVKLAMDDFGTGTSSLGFLRDYPFDTIKIDRAFVNDLTVSAEVLAVNHATINLIENLGMASLAEGVEEAAQAAVLHSLGCRYAQGFYFSRPVRAEKLLAAIDSPAFSLVALTGPSA